LGNGPAVRGLQDLLKVEDPDVLFISETKMDKRRLEWVRCQIGMPNMLVKDCVGQSGGLVLFWRNGFNINLLGMPSRYHIDIEIREDDGFKWRFTGLYGEPKQAERDKTWRLLRTLKNHSSLPWLCAGDFNEILYDWEKEGGAPRSQSSLDKFRLALEDCELSDLGFKGDAFTWRNNNHEAANYIRERLDRAVACPAWRSRFPLYTVANVDPRHSDHRPVIIDMAGGDRCRREKGGVIIPRFEARWVEEEECVERIKQNWELSVALEGKSVKGGCKRCWVT
jgi:exonuclease III